MIAYTLSKMIREPRLEAAKEVARLLAYLALVCLASTQAACDQPIDGIDGGGQAMGDAIVPDRDADTGPSERDADASAPEPKPDTGAQPEPDGEVRCERNEDCQDELVCNGSETCVDGECQADLPMACPIGHPCTEAVGDCDCTDADYDDDGAPSDYCEPGPDADCDDNNSEIGPDVFEVCDLDGVDEDCNPTTFHGADDGDNDDDGHFSDTCRNRIPGTNNFNRGDDCNDRNPTIHPGQTEACDYEDNDCNGTIDEAPGPNGEKTQIEGGLREKFYPDTDGDGCGDQHADARKECGHRPPFGFVHETERCDCDDSNPKINERMDERCDGDDNDCDHSVDEEKDLVHEYDFPQTDVKCVEGGWRITVCPDNMDWCDESTVRFGCETDLTLRSSCRSCDETHCTLSCGQAGCDDSKELALGTFHSCVRTDEGNVACWGFGLEGRLGTGNIQSAYEPVGALIEDVSEIGAGFGHSCAVTRSTGVVWCWGQNQSAQLGDPAVGAYSVVPIRVVGSQVVGAVQVSAGEEHTCAVLESGLVYCWGEQSNGRLGHGFPGTGPSEAPKLVARRAYDPDYDEYYPERIENGSQVATGMKHSCLRIDDGGVECWGDNTYGQLATDHETVDSTMALKVEGVAGATMVAAGHNHTCALVGGEVYCWGSNGNAQLGREGTTDTYIPARVEGITGATSIALGANFSCALLGTKRVACWGQNDGGIFGTPPTQTAESATPVTLPFEGVIDLAAGSHVCVQTQDRQLHCLGSNVYGQSGNGSTSPTPLLAPVDVKPLRGSRQ